MYYEDLKPYIVGEKYFNPKTLNVGWLDKSVKFPTGKMPRHLIDKLLYLTLFDLDQSVSVNLVGYSKHPKNIIVHHGHIRGNPFVCPFCDGKEISIVDQNARVMHLGGGEMRIPAPNKSVRYAFPTMLYHYITEHDYLPPEEFLDALQRFHLDQSYDCQHDDI